MSLLTSILRQHLWALCGIILLNLLSACLGIFTIAFINRMLLHSALWWQQGATLIGLLIVLLAVTLGAQWTLTTLGHHFIWHKRSRMMVQMMETPLQALEQQGNGELLALLGADIRTITLAFVRLPELIQGVILGLVAIVWLGYLSLPVLALVILWMAVTFYLGYRMVSRVYLHIRQVREYESRLQEVFQVVIHGKKELALNPQRAQHFYQNDYQQAEQGYRRHLIRADSYHLSATHWSNIMILGLTGVIFLTAQPLQWISAATATSFALTVLFLRSPLLQAIGAWPTLLSGELAFTKINALFPERQQPPEPAESPLPANWQCLRWEDLCWHYPDSDFRTGPVNLQLRRGEILFIIGANGSGKSTLSLMLSGLYSPPQAKVSLDGQPLRPAQLRSLFSVVFTRPWLFSTLFVDPQSGDAALAQQWLEKLQLKDKISDIAAIPTESLSQGQKKRVALLLALAEKRDILFLDEWAAEQDPQFRRYFYRHLLPWLRDQGKTLMIISHDDDYFDQADRVLEMSDGQLRELSGADRRAASREAIAQWS